MQCQSYEFHESFTTHNGKSSKTGPALTKCRDWSKFISVNLVEVNYVTINILVNFSFLVRVVVRSTVCHYSFSFCKIILVFVLVLVNEKIIFVHV